MIKSLDKIPKVKQTSQRELIRRDLDQAIANHIELFEFVGDEYNYKYLAQYASEVAERYTINYFRPLLSEVATKNGWEYLMLPHEYRRNYFIKVSSREGRVFCKINYSKISWIVQKTELKEQKEREKEMRKRRKWDVEA